MIPHANMAVMDARRWVDESSRVVVLTGAGISTESGIPDFRGPEGVWTKNPKAERLSNIHYYMSDPEVRRLSWQSRAEHPAWTAVPNAGHRALVELERRGKLHALVTQNIDGLHQRAGSREVVEVHGSVREAECIHCGVRVPMEDAVASLPLPPCPECGEILKPGVVMFGELLPAQAIERAQALATEAGLLLVVGSSLEVHPVAALPGATLASGGALAIVNRGGTPWDSEAEVVLDAGAGQTLRGLAAALGMVGSDRPRRSDG
jgi:NAD-dependent protein deacetylase/lipoamidase